jgi:arylformamidase
MAQAYIDISIPVGEGRLVYPGDPRPAFHFTREDGWTVGRYEGGLHAGTHVDAPWHCIPEGKRLHEVELGAFVGPCVVADLRHLSRAVRAQDLEALGAPDSMERLIIRTRNSEREYWREPWDAHAIGLDLSAAQWCAARRLRLVGIDYLSVEPVGEAAAHRELLGHGAVILEGLWLGRVAAGAYELIASPVKLEGVDGAWCRALLRPLSQS